MNRTKVLLAPASSAYKHSLKEVFNVPGIASQIKVWAMSAVHSIGCMSVSEKCWMAWESNARCVVLS